MEIDKRVEAGARALDNVIEFDDLDEARDEAITVLNAADTVDREQGIIRINREQAIEKLASRLASQRCFDAECDGYGFDMDNPEDIAHFLPFARKEAEDYLKIILDN